MIEIDGSYGEAGGQILRTALSLSCLLDKPFRMVNIRKGRKNPGLRPQHLMCVRALGRISGAWTEGDYKGSTGLSFRPSEVRPGDYFFDIGTAGSTSLLLQSLLPPLIFTKKPSRVTLRGGTHVPFSPPFHYISEVFIPLLKILGITLDAAINTYGFYPKGGGEIHVNVMPAKNIRRINFADRGEIKTIRGVSAAANLPVSIAERQRESAVGILSEYGLSAVIEIMSVPSPGRGTFIFLMPESDNCFAGASSLGERGKKAEQVGEEAAGKFLDYYSCNACLDPNLADQIVLYLAIAGGESVFTTSSITNHILTNLWVMERFLGLKYTVEGEKGMPGKIIIKGTGLSFSS